MRRKPWVAAAAFAVLAGAALMFTNPKALTGEAGGAGCTVEDFADAELAKDEGHYLVMEVMVALALGLEQAQEYRGVAEEFTSDPLNMNDPVALANSNENNCYQTQIEQSEIASATVKVDFGNCSDQQGRIEVAVAAEFPQGTDLSQLNGLNGGDIPSEIPTDVDPNNPPDDIPADLPDDLPEDLPEDINPDDFIPTAVSYDLVMYDTERYGVLLEGLIGFTEPAEGDTQAIRTDLSFDFLDYSGTLTTTGAVTTDEGVSSVDFRGTFKSAGGLDWEVDADGLEVSEGCKGLRAGTLTANYSNPAVDNVEIVATFDGACNGCAQVQIDGRKVSDICIPDALGL